MRKAIFIFIIFVTLFWSAEKVSANLIPDASFEGGVAYWTLGDYASSISTTVARTGSKSLRLLNDGDGEVGSPNHNAGQYRIEGVVPGEEYVYTVWVYGNAVAGNGSGGKPLAIVRWRNAAGQQIDDEMYMWAPYGSYGWTSLQIYLQAPSDAAEVDISYRSWWDCTAGQTYWDDVELVERSLAPADTLLLTYQEDVARRSGGSIATSEPNYTGSGFFDATSDDAYLEWDVTGGGERVLSFRYSWEGNVRPLELFVNGATQGTQSAPVATGRRGSWASNLWTVNLPSGSNTVRLTLGSAGGVASPMIDKLDVYSTTSSEQGTADTWNMWEKTLTSSTTYTNPYSGVTISVTYTGPNDETITGKGFWDGSNSFKLRNMFPTPGTWSWTTTCTDTGNTGLHNQQGTVEVAEYSGSNPLYNKGYLKVSSNNRYLTYNDNTPFLWLADTAWEVLYRGTEAEWESYIQQRKAQHFNVIQIDVSKWATTNWDDSFAADRNGNYPYLYTGASARLNPVYWQGVDAKVQYANDQGMIVFLCAVRQPTIIDAGGDVTQIRRFARNLAARMMGNFVVYSPIADDIYTTYADESGEELAAATSVHLITDHPRFQWAPAETFFSKAYIDFAGMQTGSGWSNDPYLGEPFVPHSATLAVSQAIEWPLALYAKSPTKPVLNLEASYDAKSLQLSESGIFAQPYPTRMPRSTAYLSMLSGAKGYSYGAFGIWNWGNTVNWFGSLWTFNEALNQPSGDEMGYMHEMFSGLAWWDLVPSHELIQNQSSGWLQKMTMSKTADGRLAVAYLQDNANISISMSTFAGTMSARWFNPSSNSWESVVTPIANAGTHSFVKPSGWQDAVLVLDCQSCGDLIAPSSPSGLNVE